MHKALWLTLAALCSTGGVAWLALAMDAHWEQARGPDARPSRAAAAGLRTLGVAALAISLLLCLRADQASMAALVWIMLLALGAVVVALTLAWRPRWLRWLAGA